MNLIEHLLIPVDPNYVLGEEKIPPGALTTTKTVPYSESLRASLPSVRALNSQIIMGTKDMALRNACTIFESAASRTAQTATTSARYWETAVQLRRKNWPLVTAPFHQQGDGVAGRAVNPSDPLAKDFRVAYSMEYCEFSSTRHVLWRGWSQHALQRRRGSKERHWPASRIGPTPPSTMRSTCSS